MTPDTLPYHTVTPHDKPLLHITFCLFFPLACQAARSDFSVCLLTAVTWRNRQAGRRSELPVAMNCALNTKRGLNNTLFFCIRVQCLYVSVHAKWTDINY